MTDQDRIAELEKRVAELEKLLDRGVDDIKAMIHRLLSANRELDAVRNARLEIMNARLENLASQLEQRKGIQPSKHKPSLQ
ncbi:hypothetical protein [Bradyrhizobium sp.]|jgi:hypothetical protein|uniref:hypothetical protein n=1 Tax=Bradyrhizobium sp. TaxID=376 RepID=UPI002BDFC567|nr:hypothetical protein [Bradyrhizobium sp.]HWX60202.1 hypothetical protein [Bradyrhizobium sp.]